MAKWENNWLEKTSGKKTLNVLKSGTICNTVDAGYISHAILANIRYISQKLDDGFSILK